LTIRKLFKLPLQQAEGFVQSLLILLPLDLEAPDHTTLSRRQQGLAIDLRMQPSTAPRQLVVDSTGLKLYGENLAAGSDGAGNTPPYCRALFMRSTIWHRMLLEVAKFSLTKPSKPEPKSAPADSATRPRSRKYRNGFGSSRRAVQSSQER